MGPVESGRLCRRRALITAAVKRRVPSTETMIRLVAAQCGIFAVVST